MEKYNTFWGRFWAGFIDSLILAPIGFLDLYFLTPNRHIGLVMTWVAISYSIFFIYSIYFHWKTGQTIGKMLTNVRVMDVSEERGLTLKQAFLRDSIYIVIQIIGMILILINIWRIGEFSEYGIEPYNTYLNYLSLIWFLLEIVTMLSNEKRRAFHDKIANTVVVKI